MAGFGTQAGPMLQLNPTRPYDRPTRPPRAPDSFKVALGLLQIDRKAAMKAAAFPTPVVSASIIGPKFFDADIMSHSTLAPAAARLRVSQALRGAVEAPSVPDCPHLSGAGASGSRTATLPAATVANCADANVVDMVGVDCDEPASATAPAETERRIEGHDAASLGTPPVQPLRVATSGSRAHEPNAVALKHRVRHGSSIKFANQNNN